MNRNKARLLSLVRLPPDLATHILSLGFISLLLQLSSTRATAQALQVQYGNKGIESLSYRGVVLEDVSRDPSDAFHIWHMRSTDLAGAQRSDGAFGWGESNDGETWDASTRTETYRFPWGSIQTQFVQAGDQLDIRVTETNRTDSGIIFDGAEIYPLTLHFPEDPKGFSGYTQYAVTTIEPGISVAEYGSGRVTEVIPDESMPLYGGWKQQAGNAYSPILAGTYPDGIASFLPHNNLELRPGQSLTYSVSLRFTPAGVAADTSDATSSFARTYPSQMHWTDKRIIGTAYLASSASGGDITRPAGLSTNPRRYFNDASINVTSNTGIAAFQSRILMQARTNVVSALAMNAQGVITWDIEGEQYPQSTSYVCSPDQIAATAPEMESVIRDPLSAYNGRKLDDAYFAIMSSAGLRTGVCIRPQVFTQSADGSAHQTTLSSNAEVVANLEQKARYANSRWGSTMFYVDSTVNADGGTLDPAIFQRLTSDLPNFLFIPEESTTRYYAYTAPFYSFVFHGDLGTASSVRDVYPNAFGANLINDVNSSALANQLASLTASVQTGDILMGHADYWQANDPTLVAMYAAAGKVADTPTRSVPHIIWNPPGTIPGGTVLGSAQLNATADVPGTFAYSPAVGAIPQNGTVTLVASFTPTDSRLYEETSVSRSIVVSSPPAAAAPSTEVPAAEALRLLWPGNGTVVSGVISVRGECSLPLDAAGSYLMMDGQEVGTNRTFGPYMYFLDTRTLSNGLHTLQLWAHDIGNITTITQPITITVAN